MLGRIYFKSGILLLFLLFFTNGFILSQTATSLLGRNFSILGSNASDDEKQIASDSISIILKKYLENADSIKGISSLKNLGVIRSDDNSVSIYTWNFQKHDFSYKYGCIIQYKQNGEYFISELIDATNDIPLNKTLKANEWYGCLYYAVIVKTKRKKKSYTLLGWDANDNVIARKMIDILTFSKKGEPELGANVFEMENKTQKRVLFNFSASGSMMLTYDKDYKRIIFDHLSPASPEYEGQFQYYGSDFSYDGFKYQKNKWVFEELLDPRNKD